MPKKIEISHRTIIFTVIFLLSLWFIVQIIEIISWVFISFILMAALKPTVDSLHNLKIPRALSIIFIYVLIFIVFGFVVSSIIPPLVNETVHLSESLPSFIRLIAPNINLDPQNFSKEISSIGTNLLSFSVGIFNNIISLFTITVISFYLLLERKNLDSYLELLLGETLGKRIEAVFNRVEERLGHWVRGQLALMLSIGILTYIGLLILGILYSLLFAIIAGILEIVPTLGPIISAIPAVLVSFTVTSLHPIFTSIMYLIIQQVENQVIVPVIMSKIVGVPPLVTIIAVMVGARIGGIVGAVLAVPLVVTIETVFREYYQLQEEKYKPVNSE